MSSVQKLGMKSVRLIRTYTAKSTLVNSRHLARMRRMTGWYVVGWNGFVQGSCMRRYRIFQTSPSESRGAMTCSRVLLTLYLGSLGCFYSSKEVIDVVVGSSVSTARHLLRAVSWLPGTRSVFRSSSWRALHVVSPCPWLVHILRYFLGDLPLL
jgi:hypothetical protein